MKKVYISGQISGLPSVVYMIHFQRGEEAVLVQGNRQPVNPTKMWGQAAALVQPPTLLAPAASRSVASAWLR